MSFAAKIFSLEGRLGRRDWWMLGGLVLAVQAAVFVVLFQAAGGVGAPAALDSLGKPTGDPTGAGVGGVLTALICAALLGVWPNLAINIKRWHDRDKGAAWVLLNFVPYIGPMWATVELGFLAGTVGPNRFGPDRSGPACADVFDDVDADERASAAVARWSADVRTDVPRPAAAAAAPAGFGKRTVSPAWT